MNKANGFITLHRKILDWRWFKDSNTLCMFIYLLLAANFTDGDFETITVKRGQLVTSIPSLSAATGLSARQVRTALDHLKLTGEVTDKVTNKYRLITIVKYDEYQTATDNLTDKRQANDSQVTGNRQATDRQMTGNRQQYNNNNNNNNGNNETMEQYNNGERTASRFTPPSLDEVRAYCQERGNNVDPEKWMNFYESNGWKVGKNSMKDWRAAVRTWEKRETEFVQTKQKQNPAAQFTQRDYSSADDMALSDMLDILMGSQYGGSGA